MNTAKVGRNLYSLSTIKTKLTTFWHSVIKPQLKALLFGTAIKEITASLPMIVFHLTCVVPIPGRTFQTSYILGINKTVSSKTPNSKIMSILNTSNHENTTKCAQNIHREPSHKHTATPLTDGCNSNRMVKLSPFN